MIPFFTATADCYNLPVTTSSANLVMENQTVTPNAVIKLDNAGPNVAYLVFGTDSAVAQHPTAGTGNSAPCIPLLPSSTTYVNPDLGFYTGNIVVAAITVAGSATVLITPGV